MNERCPTCHRPTPSKVALRSLEQNARLWAMLGDISRQMDWHGRKLADWEWKCMFSAQIYGQNVVPNLSGTGFVVLGQSTRKMSVATMSEMLELMTAFCVEHDIKLREPLAA